MARPGEIPELKCHYLKVLRYSFIYIFQKPINCECNAIGGYNGTCNEQTGKCLCSPGYSGDTCEKRKLTKGKHQCSKYGNKGCRVFKRGIQN